jgi:hypothetical protein
MSERIYTGKNLQALSVGGRATPESRNVFRAARRESAGHLLHDSRRCACSRRAAYAHAEQNGWWYVCGDLDWLKVASVEGVGPTTAFETIWPFPEAGEKAFRWEVFCRVFSRHAFSVSGSDIYSVTGEIPSRESIEAEVTQLGEWQRHIGFVFNHDAAQQTPPADAPKRRAAEVCRWALPERNN